MHRLAAHTLALALVACAPAPPPAADPCRVGELTIRWEAPQRALDLLVVLDTRGDDDVVERPILAARLAHLARVLASGDVDGDGAGDFPAPLDPMLTLVTACDTSARSLTRAPDEEPIAFARSVEDAVLAMAPCPHSAPLRTARDRLAGGVHRSHAALVIALVTDEDEPDASLLAPDLALPLRELPGTIVALLAGLDPARARWSDEWDAWRADPGCSGASLDATPAPALVAAMRALHERGVGVQLGSVCRDEWLDTIGEAVPPAHEHCVCVPRVEPTAEGLADCTMLEQLGPRTLATRCAELPGRSLEQVVRGHERCAIEPSIDGAPGWIAAPAERDPSGCCPPGRASIRFVDLEPEPGATLELRCVSIPPSEGC